MHGAERDKIYLKEKKLKTILACTKFPIISQPWF